MKKGRGNYNSNFNQTNDHVTTNNDHVISQQNNYNTNGHLLTLKPSSYLNIPKQTYQYSNEALPINDNSFLNPPSSARYYGSSELENQTTATYLPNNLPDIHVSNNSLDVSRESFTIEGDVHRNQLRILYEARGRKIEELQKYIENITGEFEKDQEVLKHQVTMLTSKQLFLYWIPVNREGPMKSPSSVHLSVRLSVGRFYQKPLICFF